MLTTTLVIISSILTLVSVIPYLAEVVKGTTKPRVVSWLVWSILTGIAAIATWTDGQYPTAVLLSFATLATFLVVILGWRHGNRRIERLDIICLTAALVGIILWQVFNAPEIAIIATILIDLVGGIPTLVHAWKKPHEETAITFFLAFLGAVCTLAAVGEWTITSVAYPLYLVIINLTFSAVTYVGQKRKSTKSIKR